MVGKPPPFAPPSPSRLFRHRRSGFCEILQAEQSRVPQHRTVESVDDGRADDPGMLEAYLPGRLLADRVIQRIDRAGAGGLHAVIVVVANESFCLLEMLSSPRTVHCCSVLISVLFMPVATAHGVFTPKIPPVPVGVL